MVELQQDSNGNYRARKRLPDDVREDYGRLYGARHEAKFFAKASDGRLAALQEFRTWDAEVTRRIDTIRKGQRGDGIDLSRKDTVALAGEWYTWFVEWHEKATHKPEAYVVALWEIIDRMQQYAPDEVREQPIRELQWARAPDVRAAVRPVVADLGQTSQFLANRGVALTNKARALFLDCVLDNYIAALSLLEQHAKGDYSPDELPTTFPPFAPRQQSATIGLTPWELFEAWVKVKQPAQSTVESWRTVFNALTRQFQERAGAAITADEAQGWLDGLVTEERSAFTVRGTWLRATRTVFAWGAKRKLTGNPFAAAGVEVPRRTKHRPKYFYENEQTTILRAASAVTEISNPYNAACRWVPWLLAYTGARPGEITQLRGTDVQQMEGVWTINLTPEAGTIKGGSARRVPIHPHLLAQGFLGFAQSAGDAPLFYRPRRKHSDNSNPTKQKKPPGAQVRQRLAAWVREVGITDDHLSPNHAWRHTFKQIGRRIAARGVVLDYICGHAPATEGDAYGEPTLADMAKVIEKFPQYEI